MTTPAEWIAVTTMDELWDGAGVGMVIAGREIALFRIGETVYATDNRCTHGHARLCEGFIEGHEIECPLHQGRFDLRSGAPTCAPASVAVKSYPVRIDGDQVHVAIDGSTAAVPAAGS